MCTGSHPVCSLLTLRLRSRGGATIGHPNHIMHYEINFDNDRDALLEVLAWLGPQRYKVLARAARTEKVEYIELLMNIAGIQGFPINAIFRRYHTN